MSFRLYWKKKLIFVSRWLEWPEEPQSAWGANISSGREGTCHSDILVLAPPCPSVMVFVPLEISACHSHSIDRNMNKTLKSCPWFSLSPKPQLWDDSWKAKMVMSVCRLICNSLHPSLGFPCGLAVKTLPNAEGTGSISGWRRSPGGEHGNPLQYSCLENPMHRGAWWVHEVAKSQTQLSN